MTSPSSTSETVFGFDSNFLQRLERLALLNRRPLSGFASGPRRSRERGSSVEFADFRNYTPGDDFRRIDWNAYARLDRLFLRLYQAEQITTLSVLFDHSPSMAFGSPPKNVAAARLAAVLTYVALYRYDRVAVMGWGDKIDRRLPARSGKRAVPEVWQFLNDLTRLKSGPTDFSALRTAFGYQTKPGLCVVISDFLTDSDWRSALVGVQSHGQELIVVQVLSPDETQPPLRGNWKLVDTENQSEVEVTLSPRILRRYQEEVHKHVESIRGFCTKHRMTFLQISSDASLSEDVLHSLHRLKVMA